MPGKGRWDHCDADFLYGREIDSADPNNGDVPTWNTVTQKLEWIASGSSPNTPTADEKAALVGTDGSPSAANPYVTDSDPRLTGGNSYFPGGWL
jgi:hypothetical protein